MESSEARRNYLELFVLLIKEREMSEQSELRSIGKQLFNVVNGSGRLRKFHSLMGEEERKDLEARLVLLREEVEKGVLKTEEALVEKRRADAAYKAAQVEVERVRVKVAMREIELGLG